MVRHLLSTMLLFEQIVVVNWILWGKYQWNFKWDSKFLIKKLYFKTSSAKWQPLYSGLNVPRKFMMTSSNGNIFRVTGPLCGEFTGPGEFPTQRPVTRSFDVFFDLRLNKRLSKQPWGWWFEPPSWSLWRHRNVAGLCYYSWGVFFQANKSVSTVLFILMVTDRIGAEATHSIQS